MRKLVLILIAFFAMVTFIRAYTITDTPVFSSKLIESSEVSGAGGASGAGEAGSIR